MATFAALEDLAKTVRCLRAVQRAYMVVRENYPEDHDVRVKTGALVARLAAEVDNALALVGDLR